MNDITIDKTGWKKWRFDEFAQNISERVEPSQTDMDVYVGLEHIDPDTLHLSRHGHPSDVEGTKLRFYKGDIIFGRRRAYQRKTALATTDGISLNETGTTWSRQRELFLGTFSTTSKVLECIQKTDDTIIYPDSALDCNMFETKLLCYLKNNPNTNLLEISKHLGISKRVVNKTILSLVGKGFIKKEGTSQNCRWIVKS